MLRARPRIALAALAMLGLLASLVGGCGGGVDSGGTGHVAPPSLARGPITGFGSIVVAGVRYDESQATISDDDGNALAAAALQLGMLATIEADAVDASGVVPTARARSVRVGEQVLGPVDAVDPLACSVRVLGQTVAAVAATAVDASVPTSVGACRLSRLQPGDWLRAYGSWDAALQRVVASRIERLASLPTAWVLRGDVTAYQPDSQRITIAGQLVDLSALAPSALPRALAVGDAVRVRLRAAAPVDGRHLALSLRRADLPAATVASIELEGRISQFSSAQQFRVDGVPVDASRATVTPGAGLLALGAKVEMSGAMVDGTLVASRIEVEAGGDDHGDHTIELEGRIGALDTTARTFLLRNTLVSYGASPAYEGGREADLANNRKVKVKGRLSADGQTVVATEIDLED